MAQFLFLTIGFEKPTPDIMQAWGAWFEDIKEHIVSQHHLPWGLEISHAGRRALPMDLDATTGMMIIEAKDREEAEQLAASNPFITSIRIYEMG